MNLKGKVYHNPTFKFHDGEEGNKLLILLNTPTNDDEYLFVKTTSHKVVKTAHQEKERSTIPGCGKNPIYEQGEYFLPKGTLFFDLPTWVIVSEIYPISPDDIKTNPNWHEFKNGNLPPTLVDSIIDCLLKFMSDDIPEIYEKWLKPSVDAGRLKLAAKFKQWN